MVTFKSVQCHPGLTYVFNFWHSGTLVLSPERQSAWMSEIKNNRLRLYGAEHSKCNHMITLGFKGLSTRLASTSLAATSWYIQSVRVCEQVRVSTRADRVVHVTVMLSASARGDGLPALSYSKASILWGISRQDKTRQERRQREVTDAGTTVPLSLHLQCWYSDDNIRSIQLKTLIDLRFQLGSLSNQT